MRDYELMTIHRPDLAEDEVANAVAAVESHLSGAGAEPTKRDLWGKRRFAYEIDHLTEGYYSVVSFKGTPEMIASLDRTLTLSDQVVRHKIVRLGE